MGFPINPPNAALVYPDGRCTDEWYRFFLSIQKIIGGPDDPFEGATLLAYQARQAFDGSGDLSDAFLGLPAAPRAPAEVDSLQPYPNGFLTRISQDEGDARYVRQDQGSTWTAPTGTLARTALASYPGQVVSNPPTQAQVQAIDDGLKALSQAVVAIITDLRANGALKD